MTDPLASSECGSCPELSATVLHLTAESGEPLPPGIGHYAHAALLHLVHNEDSLLAQRLHDGARAKPFTLSFLPGSTQGGAPLLRVASLDPQLTAVLSRMAGYSARPIISLGVSHFSVSIADRRSVAALWMGEGTWKQLTWSYGQERCITILFASATAFSFGKRKIPLPQPDLVFGSLLKKWNTFSPVQLPADLLGLFKEQLAVSEINNLNTQMLDFGRYKEKGFTGSVTFEALGSWGTEELRAFNALADFAFYAGVGYKTTMGMGLTRRITNKAEGR